MTDPRLCRVCGGVVRTAMGGRYPVHAWYLPEGVPDHRAEPVTVPVSGWGRRAVENRLPVKVYA